MVPLYGIITVYKVRGDFMNLKTKVCIKCSRELELNPSNFFKRKGSKDGFRNDCKDCRKEARTTYYEANKEKHAIANKEYREKNKEKITVQQKQYREENKEKIQKYLESTRELRKEKSRKRWEANKKYFIEKAKEWKQENKERVKLYKRKNRERERILERKRYRTEEGRKKAQMRHNNYLAKKNALLNDFTLEEWKECTNHFNTQCAYCGCIGVTLEQEHFIPVSKNGAFTKSNILPACRSCNASKRDCDFFEWYPKQEFYSKERKHQILKYLGLIRDDSLSLYR